MDLRTLWFALLSVIGACVIKADTLPMPEISGCRITTNGYATVYEGGTSDPLCRAYREDLGVNAVEPSFAFFLPPDIVDAPGAQYGSFLFEWNPLLRSVFENDGQDWWGTTAHVRFDYTIPIYGVVSGSGYAVLGYSDGTYSDTNYGDSVWRPGWELTFAPPFRRGDPALVAQLRITTDQELSASGTGLSEWNVVGVGALIPLKFYSAPAPVPEPSTWGMAVAAILLACSRGLLRARG